MRTIKFRAWDVTNKTMWQTGDEGKSIDKWTFSIYSDEKTGEMKAIIYDNDIHPTERYLPLMQHTGLYDIKGQSIYEGDIVECVSNGVNRIENRIVCYDLHQAKYKTVPLLTYFANSGNGGWTGYELRSDCEVVGNIHENPELLERGGRK